MSRKRREVFIEIDELLMLDRAGRPLRGWCKACGAEVALLAPSWAALCARRSERAVYQLAETGRLHYTETATGRLLICLVSLARLTQTPPDADAPAQ
jgi:hypothetical protein